MSDNSKLLDLLNAVGHHGINIGEGIFEIGASHVAEAQRLYHEISQAPAASSDADTIEQLTKENKMLKERLGDDRPKKA